MPLTQRSWNATMNVFINFLMIKIFVDIDFSFLI